MLFLRELRTPVVCDNNVVLCSLLVLGDVVAICVPLCYRRGRIVVRSVRSKPAIVSTDLVYRLQHKIEETKSISMGLVQF